MRLLVIIFFMLICLISFQDISKANEYLSINGNKIVSVYSLDIFLENTTEFSTNAFDILDEIIKEMKILNSACDIEVYTCDDLKNLENWEISLIRANKIFDYMVKKGKLNSESLSAFGYGKCLPLKDNQKQDQLTNNSRIDFIFLKNK